MSSVLVHHHLGMGDHIICNGMVRKIASNYDSVSLIVLDYNMKSVVRMFDDTTNIKIIPIPSTGWTNEIHYVNAWVFRFPEIKRIGIPGPSERKCDKFDAELYRSAGIDHSFRWSGFSFRRDEKDEQDAYEMLVGDNKEPYIFVHDDPSRGFHLNLETNGVRVVKNDPRINIFSLIKVLEGAKEIHVMESSISALIEHLPSIRDEQLFYHPEVRNYSSFLQATTKRNWRVV